MKLGYVRKEDFLRRTVGDVKIWGVGTFAIEKVAFEAII